VQPTVYIETSVISYRAARPSRDLIVAAHQQMTHEWWDRILPQCDAFVSPVVLEEIAHGDPDAAQRRLQSVTSFPVLEVVPEVHTVAAAYFAAIPLPDKAQADAYHLALAAWHGLDYLVSCILELHAYRQWPSPHDRRRGQCPVWDTHPYHLHSGRAYGGVLMVHDPLQELRDIRRQMEQACEERGQAYAEYLSQAQRIYSDRLVRRAPKPRLKVKELQTER
jgi:predicted nucleic acid-binding protein